MLCGISKFGPNHIARVASGFRLVSEQRKTRFWPRENLKREPKKERGGRVRRRKETYFPFFSTPIPAFLLAPFFAQSLTLRPRSLLLNRTETLATQAILTRN